MRAAMGARLTAGAVGVAMLGFGAWHLLTDHDLGQKESIGKWLLGGVIVHDGILAPLVFACCALAWRFSGLRLRRGLAMFLLVGGSLTIVAGPAILRRGDNPNLTVTPLDYSRNLALVLAGLAVCVLLYALGGLLIDRRRSRSGSAATPQPELTADTEGGISAQPGAARDTADPVRPESAPSSAQPEQQHRETGGPEDRQVPVDDPQPPVPPAQPPGADGSTGHAGPADDQETAAADEEQIDGQG